MRPSRKSTGRTTVVVLGATVLVAVSLLGFGLAGTVAAGDTVTFFTGSPQDVDAEPGEEIEVDVHLRTQGTHGGVGVQSATLHADYDPDYLEVTDVEGAGWLEDGDATVETVTETVDDENGEVVLEQHREQNASGVIGEDVFATLTLEVREDAPSGNTTIGYRESGVTFTNEYPSPIRDHHTTITIDDDSDDAVPGFGAFAGGLAVLAVAAFLVRHRRR
ncbi:cohesin domain-containing protein [Natrialbaceae archaeon A-gly3]